MILGRIMNNRGDDMDLDQDRIARYTLQGGGLSVT